MKHYVRFVHLGLRFGPGDVAWAIDAILADVEDRGPDRVPSLTTCLIPAEIAESFHNTVVPAQDPAAAARCFGRAWDSSSPLIFRLSYPHVGTGMRVAHVVVFFTGGPAGVYYHPGRVVPAPAVAEPEYWQAAEAIELVVRGLG